ncbi:MAG: TonB-dependent receptor [Bacteroidota bacterium]
MRSALFLLTCCINLAGNAQQSVSISGRLLNQFTKSPIAKAHVFLEGAQNSVLTDKEGEFQLQSEFFGESILTIKATDFITKRIVLILEGNPIDLGTIVLENDVTIEQTDNLITLTETALLDEEETISVSSGLLQASKDVFLNRSAFDFGQAFFRVRGYDSREGGVFINAVPMNKFFDGRPQWNNWGGLNDIIRNQEFVNGLGPADFAFRGILGNTNIDTRPSGLRPGVRLSSSISNRTYNGRVMATYNSGLKENGLAFAFSGSRRWAEEGFIEGTLYDAYSFFGTLEYHFNKQHSVLLTSILAKNRRGRSSAITEEVFKLKGKRYNPYWGYQNGDVRNARERDIFEPILMLNHYFNSGKFNLRSGVSVQFGANSRSRLGYYDAPNPDPTYYRYLPSFYINNPIGADFINANLALEGFLKNPQINWANSYRANLNPTTAGKAAYVLYDDTAKDFQISVGTVGNLKLGNRVKVDFACNYQELTSENYAKIKDLLAADYHEDIDPFSNTMNDINGSIRKVEGDIFNYHYEISASNVDAFGQVSVVFNRWNVFFAAGVNSTIFQRDGLFQNERFLNSSLGKGEKVDFTTYRTKTGVDFRFSGRHWVKVQGTYMNRPPVLQNLFINPRETNEVVPEIQEEVVSSIDLNYFFRLPDLTGRVSGFYTRFQNTTDINFFFVDSGVGSDFVQEVITDLDKLHMGIELGVEYKVSPQVKLSIVANIAKHLFASDPSVTINFDTAGAEEDLIDPEGNIALGVAAIKDYKLAQGPQQAYALGVEYRDPKYWWIGATTNYLANNYANISTITRTQSFYLDPDTGERFIDATDANVSKILRQQKLDDFYLLNLVGGKSWLLNKKYISVFASVNNVFDTLFRTGGYEQSRNGNYGQLQQDNLSGTPSFAPKFWYGYGRTYFLNLAISF